jgi:hypothetical protein
MVEGLPDLEVLDDEMRHAPYSIGNSDSGDEEDHDKKNDSYDDLDKFCHVPDFLKVTTHVVSLKRFRLKA